MALTQFNEGLGTIQSSFTDFLPALGIIVAIFIAVWLLAREKLL